MPLWMTTTSPEAAGGGGAGQLGLGRGQLARLLGDADAAGVVEDGDAGAVVAAVLQPGEAIEDDGCRLAAADVAHDAAHGVLLRPRRLAGQSEQAARPRLLCGGLGQNCLGKTPTISGLHSGSGFVEGSRASF